MTGTMYWSTLVHCTPVLAPGSSKLWSRTVVVGLVNSQPLSDVCTRYIVLRVGTYDYIGFHGLSRSVQSIRTYIWVLFDGTFIRFIQTRIYLLGGTFRFI